MRIMIFYDLPMDDNDKIREYNTFRKKLIRIGFYQLQFSIYVKVVQNENGYKTFIRQIQGFIPQSGNIRILKITEKQYESMLFLQGKSSLHELVVGDKEVVYFGGIENE